MNDWINRVHFGDCLETLRRMPDGIVNTCVTSPPYFGLRDYGHPGQIGLEPTPDEFIAKMVAVFREVRRVLRDDGTLWLNLGDSYSNGGRTTRDTDDKLGARGMNMRPNDGAKPKDLLGIPWRVAFALQQPYYTGRIRAELDRVWLAAMIDAEGCLFIHKRKAGTDSGARFTKIDGTTVSYERKQDTYGAGLEVANTHLSIVERCRAITGLGTITTQDKDRRQTLYRWHLRGDEARSITREVYPYLVAKQHQARLLCGCPTSGEPANAVHQALIGLHGGTPTDVDFKPPAPMTEPGYYLRQDVIWSKLNPMPESVTDRCTKAHEYLFLLTKSERYYWDAEAMKEPAALSSLARWAQDIDSQIGSDRVPGKTNGNMKAVGGPRSRRDSFKRDGSKRAQVIPGQTVGTHRADRDESEYDTGRRNRRSVWTVATKPYSGAHFATFPPELIEPCILAGAPAGGVVLDPFFGSGTTGEVSQRLERNWIGCELNPDYKPLQDERLRQPGLVLQEAA